jgi:hypothetical protein
LYISFVFEIGRITEEDKSTLEKFKEQFGDEILEHMIFVFTHYGKWKRTKKPFREYVQSTEKSFPILKKYNDRFVAFELTLGSEIPGVSTAVTCFPCIIVVAD